MAPLSWCMVPLVSIITATRNARADLPGLAEAVLRLPSDRVEWIVIDGASTDGTTRFLEGLGDPRVRWWSEPDSGIYDAWNKGVDRALGRWILFLGADDRPGPGWIEACAAAPEVDLVYGDLLVQDAAGTTLARVRPGPWETARTLLPRRMTLPHPGLAHHRRLFASRRFDPSFRIAGDHQFLAGAGPATAEQLPGVQAVVRLGGVSNRPDRVGLAYQEHLRVLREHGLPMPLRDRANWALKRVCARTAPGLYRSLQAVRWRLE